MEPVKTVLVTGARGFIGKNLVTALRRRPGVRLIEFDLDNNPENLSAGLAEADVVYHLAGVNRPQTTEEFETGNAGLTRDITRTLEERSRRPLVAMSSSTQAVFDNPYGTSKRRAEHALEEFSSRTGSPVRIYRLPGVFGKWCRPNYNSVVATFCYNLSRELPITISDVSHEIELVYVDDVVHLFLGLLESDNTPMPFALHGVEPVYRVTLGDLADRIRMFRDMRKSLTVPDLSDRFNRCLYSTYLSYLDPGDFGYDLKKRADQRGVLVELLRSDHFGQLFVSRTNPGVVRGNHYHDSKVEKFCVLEGDALIRFRHLLTDEVISYPVSGREFRVVDIPPGYAHSIENVGQREMVVLFWANEVFDANRPDTYPGEVGREEA